MTLLVIPISFAVTPLNPCHFVTSPFRGMPPSAVLQSGVHAASICLADLADADDAALTRLMMSQLEQHCLWYPTERKILVQILLIRKLYLHLQSQGEFA